MVKRLTRLLQFLCLAVLLVTLSLTGRSQSLAGQYEWTKTTPWQGSNFSEGVVAVCYQEGPRTCGYLDKGGRLALMTNFSAVGDFHEGMASVTNGRNYGFIDRSGKVVVPLKFDQVTDFSEGLATVAVGSKWGYIDKQGRIVVPLKYAWSSRFRDGVAVVGEKPNYEQGLVIDRTNRVIKSFHPFIENNLEGYVPHPFPSLSSVPSSIEFSNGLIPVFDKQKGFGNMDIKGQLAIPYQYDEASSFSEGLAVFRQVDSHGKISMGYINTKGKVLISIPPLNSNDENNSLSLFHEGLSAISSLVECNYINKKGGSVLKIPSDDQFCSPFQDGLSLISGRCVNAGVIIPSFQKFVNKSGKTVISIDTKLYKNIHPSSSESEYEYPQVYNHTSLDYFYEGRVHITYYHSGVNAYLNKKGKVVFRSPLSKRK